MATMEFNRSTDRVLTEREMGKSRRRYQAILSHVGDIAGSAPCQYKREQVLNATVGRAPAPALVEKQYLELELVRYQHPVNSLPFV